MDTLFDHYHAQRQIDRTPVRIASLLGDQDIFPPLLLTQECIKVAGAPNYRMLLFISH